GYGQPDAPIWFLGMEEGIGKHNTDAEKEAAVEKNLSVRREFRPYEDLPDAMQQLGLAFYEMPSSPTQVWTWMARIAKVLDGGNATSDLQYIVQHLGRKGGKTFLADLLPLPAPGLDYWPTAYKSLYADRKAYWEDVWNKRQAIFRDLIQQNQSTLRYLF